VICGAYLWHVPNAYLPERALPSTIQVRGPDGALKSRIQAWLDATELAPPRPLFVDLEPFGDLPPMPAEPPIFEQPEIAIHRGADSGAVSIRWLTAPAVAEIPRDEDRARLWISEAAAADLERCCTVLMGMVLIFLPRRAGWHHLHAVSAIDPAGRGWLLAGDWKAGKSTTAALLASRRWAVGNDDMIFLTRSQGDVIAVARRAPIALRAGGRALLGRLGGSFDERRQKTLFTPEELGGAWAPRVRPDILLFISVGDTETTVERISAGEVLSQLVRWSAWVILEPSLAQEHLELLADLGRQARCYRAALGPDLFEHPDRLLELVS
jgi:hypothetical protein